VGGGERVAAAPPDLPRQSAAGLHAHVAGLRVVPADRRGVDRDGRLPRLPLRAVAGACLFQILRHGAGAQAGIRLCDGPAAAVRPLGRGAGMGQTLPFAGDGPAPHDETRAGRPCGAVGSLVRLPGPFGGRKRDLRPLRRRGIPHRIARRLAGRSCRGAAAHELRVGGVVVLFVVPRGFLRGAALLALHAYFHRDSAHLPAPLRPAVGREGDLLRPFPDRCLLALRHLHRPLPVAERAGKGYGAVGLFPARPPLRHAAA